MVYAARVIGATCNCVTDTTLSCVNYTQELTGLSAEVVAMGECDGGRFRTYSIDMCDNLSEALSVNTG